MVIPVRPSGRLLVLDERDRVLLFRHRDPVRDRDDIASPGGGVEAGESYADAALREMAEELLIDDVDLGPAVWHRSCEIDFLGIWTRVEERFFLVRIEASRLAPYQGHLAHENVLTREWWTLDELDATDQAVWPSGLGALVRSLLADGLPSQPIAIGA
jgi:8-oxo-dGTP pyrophosphatase MutT (NUDIX family)